ncbi:MAG: alpha/beta hydrolase [Lachnospiraceae bacterium]|nr:alpha/beta hydrolase [Lachnospiraceae bacterium]
MVVISEAVQDIRTNWAISDAKRDEGLTTPEDIKRYDDISYGPHGVFNLLDIYHKKDVTEPQPVIVNIHGGGWVYGNKEIYQFYCMNLAQRGFAVVNFNYRLAPEVKYPAPLEDINAVMTFIKEHGDTYHLDTGNVFVVGDSAGGQLASQYLTIYSNPEYAKYFDFKVPDIQIRAAGLNCGLYDMKKSAEVGLEERIEDYVGKENYQKDFNGITILESMDVIGNMTENYVPSFVMSAVNDYLVEYVEPMYLHLKNLGVDTEMKIYGSKEREEVAHVFHVNIKLEEARMCNDDECAFFRKHMV